MTEGDGDTSSGSPEVTEFLLAQTDVEQYHSDLEVRVEQQQVTIEDQQTTIVLLQQRLGKAEEQREALENEQKTLWQLEMERQERHKSLKEELGHKYK